jgi:hypothetical protein
MENRVNYQEVHASTPRPVRRPCPEWVKGWVRLGFPNRSGRCKICDPSWRGLEGKISKVVELDEFHLKYSFFDEKIGDPPYSFPRPFSAIL